MFVYLANVIHMTGKAYESLVEVADGEKFLQPKKLKDMKFVSHSLSAIVSFTLEYDRILHALQNLTSDEKKADEAQGYISQLTDPSFTLTLFFLKDVLTLLSHFSKLYQIDDSTVADYYNNTERLLHCLRNLEISSEDPCKDSLDALPSYFERLKSNSSFIVPSRNLRSYYQSTNSQEDVTNSIVKVHASVVKQLEQSIKMRFSSVYVPQADLIKDIALILNDLAGEFIDETVVLSFCGHCGVLKDMDKMRKHHKIAHEGLSLKTARFSLCSYTTEKGVSFERIILLIRPHAHSNPPDESSSLLKELEDQYAMFKEQFKNAIRSVKNQNKPVTLCTCMKLFYSEKQFFENVPRLIRMTLLRLMTIHVSEAICETFGSTMEQYNHRMASADIDDTNLQTEMFLNLSLPPIAEARSFIKECVRLHGKKFVLQSSARFSGRGAVLSRLTSTKSVFPFF